mmetsp:Transcript_73814/g.213832  ORF Transcript_73814/g.213832 Transcript_73814/m.213832 type:complete len:216 (-) Transcript_73814:757-1404(-)
MGHRIWIAPPRGTTAMLAGNSAVQADGGITHGEDQPEPRAAAAVLLTCMQATLEPRTAGHSSPAPKHPAAHMPMVRRMMRCKSPVKAKGLAATSSSHTMAPAKLTRRSPCNRARRPDGAWRGRSRARPPPFPPRTAPPSPRSEAAARRHGEGAPTRWEQAAHNSSRPPAPATKTQEPPAPPAGADERGMPPARTQPGHRSWPRDLRARTPAAPLS